jgi:hypothetical protein
MKKLTLFGLLLATAMFAAACGGAAENKAVAPTSLDPAKQAIVSTTESLMALDKQANEAWKNHDTKFFETFLDDKFVGYGEKGRVDKASSIKEIGAHKCTVNNFTFDEVDGKTISPEIAVLTYKITTDGTCDGQAIKPARASSFFVKRGDKWMGIYHSETTISDGSAPAANNPPAGNNQPNTAPGNVPAKPEANKAAPGDAKKTDASKAANSKPSDAKPADASKGGSEELTKALMETENTGWEAWKARDSRTLEYVTTKDISFVDAMGKYLSDRTSIIKEWTEPKCDIQSVSVSDGQATSINDTIAVLLYKANAVGTCENQKLGPVWSATLFQKENDMWKAAYIVELPAM